MSSKRARVALVCSVCGARNYKKTKARKAGQSEPLTIKKYCPACDARTEHRESK